jgi:hypothetical protein
LPFVFHLLPFILNGAMNRILPAIVIVLALAAAFFFSRPAAIPAQNQNPALSTFPSRSLSGKVFSPQKVGSLHVGLLVAGVMIADAKVESGGYTLELPSQLPFALESLKNTQLLHGDGRLPETAMGADTKLVMFDDQNGSSTLDAGEPQLEAAFFTPNKDPNLQGFFKYKLLLSQNPVSFKTVMDAASGTKNYYRYDLALQSGWNMLEGELSGGYDVRLRSENTWDIFAALPRGGNTSPPAFTPQ